MLIYTLNLEYRIKKDSDPAVLKNPSIEKMILKYATITNDKRFCVIGAKEITTYFEEIYILIG